jgi:predicted nucleic acid-binding protein
MILVDTSVWIDHLRRADARLADLLKRGRVFCHPYVIGELALGNLRRRDDVLSALTAMPQAGVASHEEAMQFIEKNSLSGCGIGYLDAHLLAATRLSPGAMLWTRDRRLLAAAVRLKLALAT